MTFITRLAHSLLSSTTCLSAYLFILALSKKIESVLCFHLYYIKTMKEQSSTLTNCMHERECARARGQRTALIASGCTLVVSFFNNLLYSNVPKIIIIRASICKLFLINMLLYAFADVALLHQRTHKVSIFRL